MNVLEKIVALEIEADNFGFSWENSDQIMGQIQSECLEINAHLKDLATHTNVKALQEEIGDLLHAVFSLCVFCKCDPKETLEKALAKFDHRLQAVKEIANAQGLTTLKGYPFDALMKIWDQAKKTVG